MQYLLKLRDDGQIDSCIRGEAVVVYETNANMLQNNLHHNSELHRSFMIWESKEIQCEADTRQPGHLFVFISVFG